MATVPAPAVIVNQAYRDGATKLCIRSSTLAAYVSVIIFIKLTEAAGPMFLSLRVESRFLKHLVVGFRVG